MARIRPAKSQGGGEGDGASSSTPAGRNRPQGGGDRGSRRPTRQRQQASREKPGSVTKAVQEQRKGSRFISDVIAELRKVQWPTRSQLMQSTAVVILVVIIVTVYLAAVDAVFSRVVDALF